MKIVIGALVYSSLGRLYGDYISKRDLNFDLDKLAHPICGEIVDNPEMRNFSKYE